MIAHGYEGLDRISIAGLRAHGFHGVLPQEREQGQEFVVDVVMHAEVRPAGRTDDLADTVDYSKVATAVADCVTGDPLNLIEALAQRIADRVLRFGHVSIVEVTVHKPSAPIDLEFADVSVRVVRVA